MTSSLLLLCGTILTMVSWFGSKPVSCTTNSQVIKNYLNIISGNHLNRIITDSQRLPVNLSLRKIIEIFNRFFSTCGLSEFNICPDRKTPIFSSLLFRLRLTGYGCECTSLNGRSPAWKYVKCFLLK